jgi:hypothetical protein
LEKRFVEPSRLDILRRQLSCAGARRQAFGAQQRHAMKFNFVPGVIRF